MPKHAGRIGNAAGVYVTPQSQSKSLCHALQGAEVCALQAVARAYGPDIVLLMHDGLVSTVPLDPRTYLTALRKVVEARGGMVTVAQKAALSRETLYRTLSTRGNPTIKTLSAVLKATGLKFSVTARRAAATTRPAPVVREL